ncbi:Secretory immunoglobulin A-binding protein EsiB [Rhizobiaceae bacterium]|nr:Secretory immunoglobulin A-binding protein EsiB [Rhizobiaceae bacterium]
MKRLALTVLSALALLAAAGAAQATDGDRPGSDAVDIDPARFTKKLDAAYGAYQRGLYRTAFNLALERAKTGDVPAQTLAAEILSRGLGVPRDEREAAKWYERAAEGGDPEAQFQYALLLLDGRFVKKDKRQAYALMEAAAEAGNVLAQFNFAQLSVDLHPGPNGMERAISYYERAAKAGLPDAQYAMARINAEGLGGRPRDDTEARRWLGLAAQQNFDTAQLDLGAWLIEGRGGARDEKRGFRILKQVAEGGNVAAQARVAKLYLNGIGTEPDSIFAAAWYILARRAGLTDPQLEDFMNGLTDEEIRTALQRANRLR